MYWSSGHSTTAFCPFAPRNVTFTGGAVPGPSLRLLRSMAVRAILSSARTRRGAARDPARRGASPTREAEGATRDALDANAPDLAESEAADIGARRRAELWRGRGERAEERTTRRYRRDLRSGRANVRDDARLDERRRGRPEL